jgi:hypothetical protein
VSSFYSCFSTQRWHIPKKCKQNITDFVVATILAHPSNRIRKNLQSHVGKWECVDVDPTKVGLDDLEPRYLALAILSIDLQDRCELNWQPTFRII